MTTEPPVVVPHHRWIADKLGMSISGISLLRSGSRNPSFETMEAIENAIGWPVCDQVNARHDYAEQLNHQLKKAYEEEIRRPMPGQVAFDELEEPSDPSEDFTKESVVE